MRILVVWIAVLILSSCQKTIAKVDNTQTLLLAFEALERNSGPYVEPMAYYSYITGEPAPQGIEKCQGIVEIQKRYNDIKNSFPEPEKIGQDWKDRMSRYQNKINRVIEETPCKN